MSLNVADLSTQLKAYANWADAAKTDAVAGQKTKTDGQVTGLSKVTSAFARLFNLKSVDQARQNAIDGFKRALTEKVGEDIANAAWESVGGDTVKGLTAELVRNTLSRANELVETIKAQLCPEKDVETMLSQLTSKEVNLVVNKDALDSSSVSALCKAKVQLAKADSLLCMSPASQKEAKALADALYGVHMALGICSIADNEKLNAQIKQTQDAVEAKAKALDTQKEFLPDGEDALKGLAVHWQKSLARACSELMDANGTKGLAASSQSKLKEALGGLKDKYDGDKMLAKLQHDKKKLPAKMQTEITNCVKAALGGKIPGTLKETVKNIFTKAHLDTLNCEPWDPIGKSFEGFIDGKKLTMKSSITSGRYIDPSIGKDYEKDVNAYNCHNLGTANAVNLATSELSVNDRTVFRGVRHGVHSAEGVPNMKASDANVQRAKQTVTAAFVEYLKMNPNLVGSKNPIHFNMTSISLQTPAVIGGEKKKFFAQKAAWDEINKTGVTVTVDGKDYHVMPKVTVFSYGVNKLAVGMKGELFTGWGNVSKQNAAGLDAMLARAKNFADNCKDPKTADAVRTLSAQIKNMADHQLERTGGEEAYKMPSRLAVLSYLMGDVPVWNCKSGKDRTGMLDVEAKFLATLIDQGQKIPDPGAKLTTAQSRLLRTIMMQSGNLEMQQYNTGAAGYKLSGVGSIYRRVNAGAEEAATIKGGSGYVGK